MEITIRKIIVLMLVLLPAPLASQTVSIEVAEQATESAENLLTQAELENLVAPVALYPDTLLIQILVAATNPIQVVKSDRLLTVTEGEDPEVIKAAVEAEKWDESVEVLSIAFPEVIEDMALHIEWTETMGDAMLAQSDDVMTAVQTMRTQAINTGALISGEEQVVEVTEEKEVIIQPADPEVVYVPQYDAKVVYVEDNSNEVGDAIAAGVVAFATFAIIDDIFDDDDHWHGYWGCRNCGGWNGKPIYHHPDIDIDIDGNVRIGNDVNIVGRGDRGPDGGWKPDDRRKDDARDKIASRKGSDGRTELPVNKQDSRSDALRNKLSKQTGAPNIASPKSVARPEAVRKTMGGAGKTTANRTAPIRANSPKPAVKKPTGNVSPVRNTAKPNVQSRPKATRKTSSGAKARAASSRGKTSGTKLKRRR